MCPSDLFERPVEHFPSLRDDADEIAQLFGLVHVVGAEDNGPPLLSHLENGVAQHFLVDGIQPGAWLIQDQQLGLVNHRGNELHFLLHALGKRFHP